VFVDTNVGVAHRAGYVQLPRYRKAKHRMSQAVFEGLVPDCLGSQHTKYVTSQLYSQQTYSSWK
jgi:hypothetical protein